MEGEGMGEFQDWEVLQNSDSVPVQSPKSVDHRNDFEEIDADSEGMIRSDYFSLDNQNRYAKTSVADCDQGSVESDNPSWIDPVSETGRYVRKNSGEFWSDSSSDRSAEHKFGDFDARNELGFGETLKSKLGFEGVGEMESKTGNLVNFESDELKISGLDVKTQVGFVENTKNLTSFENFGEIQSRDKDFDKFWSDSGGVGMVSMKFDEVEKENEMGIVDHAKTDKSSEFSVDSGSGNGLTFGSEGENRHSTENENVPVGAIGPDVKPGDGEDKRRVVWWKVPFDVLRYCVLRVSPVWSFSMAAAVVGFVILGRRLYKMKRKSQGLQLKVTVDDKKVSQFMTRAARLNEAFSVVRRVPVIRPSLPAAGVNPWPVMSMI